MGCRSALALAFPPAALVTYAVGLFSGHVLRSVKGNKVLAARHLGTVAALDVQEAADRNEQYL